MSLIPLTWSLILKFFINIFPILINHLIYDILKYDEILSEDKWRRDPKFLSSIHACNFYVLVSVSMLITGLNNINEQKFSRAIIWIIVGFCTALSIVAISKLKEYEFLRRKSNLIIISGVVILFIALDTFFDF